MKSSSKLKLNSLALALAFAYPAIGFAAAPTTGAYVTDVSDQWVEDQAAQVLKQANSVLCYVGAMNAEDALVLNNGAYVALINEKLCNGSGGGSGKGSNQGASYQKAIVQSTQTAANQPVNAKVWITTTNGTITATAVANSSPSATLPLGDFAINWCGTSTAGAAGSCDNEKGFLTAGTKGLNYYSANNWSTDAVTLNMTSADAGSGTLSSTPGAQAMGKTTTSINFAYDASSFLRDDGTGAKCFDRTLANADRSAWSYGLYDTAGARVTRKSGFPIEYTDAAGVTQNGYIGFWGLWTMGTAPANGATINQITYGTAGATKTAYTLMKVGGKLMKHTLINKTLAAVDKQRFTFFSMSNVPATGTAVMSQFGMYELYWDNTKGQFMVASSFDMTLGQFKPLATPAAIANADMATAASWGLFAWTPQSTWSVSGADMANLATKTSTTPVVEVTEDIVYPDQFAAIGNLKCVADCPQPTAAGGTTAFLNDSNQGSGTWTAVPTASVLTYSLDAATGNLKDAAGTAVINNTANFQWANSINAQGSGMLVTVTDFNAVTPATAGQYLVSDLTKKVTTYYTWITSTNSWDQLSILKDAAGASVKFEAPLGVEYVVPANNAGTTKPYGDFAGSTMMLDYSGFGELWGVPWGCIDLATNLACDFATLTAGATAMPSTWSFKPVFSIPLDSTVTYTPAGGTATTYYVKPLMEEVRFKKLASCPATLTAPATATLPTAAGWTDPALAAAPTPAKTEPRVTHGVTNF